MISPLDKVLPPVGGGDLILSTAQIVSVGADGILVATLRTNVDSGAAETVLAHIDPSGHQTAAVFVSDAMDDRSHALMKAIVGASDQDKSALVLRRDNGTLLGLNDAAAITAETANAETTAGLTDFYATDNQLAIVCDDGTLKVCPALNADCAWITMDLTSLKIDGWRQLNRLAIAGNALLVGIADPVAGFDVFKADLADKAPSFSRIAHRGAERFALNAALSAMTVTNQGCLVGTAALASNVAPVGNWGAELLLIDTDGAIDLIIGQPRFSPSGLMLPASALLPGLGKDDNAAIKAIDERDGQTVIVIQDFDGEPVNDRRDVGVDLDEYRGEVRLYVSEDLEDWQPVPHKLDLSIGSITGAALTESGVLLAHEGLGEDTAPVSFVALNRN